MTVLDLPHEKAVSIRAAAEALGVSAWYIYSMKRAGCPGAGRKVFITDLRRWLREHPGFVAKDVWTQKERARRRGPAVLGREADILDRPGSG